MTQYDQGDKDAIRHIYTALGMAITQPLDEDHALGYLKTLKRERDEARAAYEAETLSTAEMMGKITQLEGECTRLHSLWHAAEERLNILGQNDSDVAAGRERHAAEARNSTPT